MAWATSGQLLGYAAQVLKVAEADLPALWTANATAAVELAYQKLLGYLSTMGYDGSQMEDSDQANQFNLSQGLFELAGFGGGFGDYAREWFDRFDIIERLKEQKFWALSVSGTPIAPSGSSAVGGIRHGQTTIVTTTAQNLWRQIYGYPGCGYRGYGSPGGW